MNFIETEFVKLSKLYGSEYKAKEIRTPGLGSSHLPTTVYSIEINYKANIIDVKYELGNKNLAEINCELSINNSHKEFEVKKRNLFFNKVFSKTSNAIEVFGPNKQNNGLISQMLVLSGVDDFAANTQFDPDIKGCVVKDKFALSTSFYLGIKDKEKAVHPVVKFYTLFIDHMS